MLNLKPEGKPGKSTNIYIFLVSIQKAFLKISNLYDLYLLDPETEKKEF